MLIYILKSAACLAILLLFYKLFLEKENMHVFKRFYLIGSLLFALIVPTIVFSEYVVVEPQIVETQTYALPQSSEIVAAEAKIPPKLEADVTDIAPLLWIVYFLGMLFFGIKFLRNLFQIFRRIRKNPKYQNSSFIQVLLQEKIPPHTFFKYIFLNKSKFESKEIPKEVLLHEETHARQKHSLDVVFIELLQVIFWVNPLIYFFKKAIKLNHEFLADSAVLNKNVDAVTYQNTLLSFLSSESAKKYQPTLPNAINYSSIKKRFTIMKSKTSKKSIVLRSFLLLPLLALLLAGFTETKMVPIVKDNHVVKERARLYEDIQILINEKGELLVKEQSVLIEDLTSFLSQLNGHLSREERKNHVRAIIIPDNNAPKEVIDKVDKILMDYGVGQINIVGPETMSPVQKGATKEQLSQYNSLAKKYNAVPKTDRVIPLEDLKTLEQVFRKMTDSQKKEARSFPECSQDGATKEQVAEYNALAKKYNLMIEEEENIWIKKGDVERLEYLHSLMTEDQRSNAEHFPDFPEPPEPPMPPNSPDEEEMTEVEREMIMQEKAMERQEREMEKQEIEMERREVEMEKQELEMERQEQIIHEQEIQTDFPAPRIIAYRVDQKPLSKELEKLVYNYTKKSKSYQNAIKDYLNNGKGNEDKIHSLYENLMETYEEYKTMATDEDVFAYPVPAYGPKVKKGDTSNIPPPPQPSPMSVTVTPESAKNLLSEDLKSKNSNGEIIEVPESPKQLKGLPPPPPSPESPLDHVIKMAKKNATFYFEGKKISSDKAIEIIKNNDEINIHSTGGKSKRPEVKLSTAPIVVD